MKKVKSFFLWGLVIGLFVACNSNDYKRTQSGLLYKIESDRKTPPARKGQVIKVNFEQKLKDSLLYSSAENGPAYVPVDSVGAIYDPAEIFPLLRQGDTVTIIFEADSIRKRRGNLPPFMKPKDKIVLGFRVLKIYEDQKEAMADQKKDFELVMEKRKAEAAKQKIKDIETLDAYLKSKNIAAQSAPKGTRVVVSTQGTGAACDSGKFVSFLYTGKSLEGIVFDSNVDPQFNHAGQPYVVQIGVGGSIEGIDDGLRLFRKGGKGVLYIPSALAYGKQGGGDKIKPDENLVFEVEVVNVTDTMPRPPMPSAGNK